MVSRKVSKTLRTIGTCLLAFMMAYMLVPAQAHAAQTGDTSENSQTASATSTSALSTADYAAIAQAETDGTCTSGQALVVYHASGAAKGSTGTLSIQSDSDPLSSAGFSAQSTWDLSGADSSTAAAAASSDGALSVQSENATTLASGSDVRVALVQRDDMGVADLVASLESLDCVECAAPNYVYEPSSLPDDTYIDQQYGLTSTTAGIDEEAALDAEASGAADNVVAILDTGVDYTNPDLENQMWNDPGDIGLGYAGSHGYNAYANTYDPMPGTAGHGTHCAGISAAQSNNATGVAGTAGTDSHTKIMGLRVTNDEGGNFYNSAVTAAYEYLVKARLAGVNVVVVNNSWAAKNASFYDPVLDYLVNQAGKAGVLSCFAAGNDGNSTSSQFRTTNLESPYAISVAASNESNGLASFSCYNETGVDVAVPGAFILSTFPNACGPTDFCALLSQEGGKTLDYYTDIASLYDNPTESGFKIGLTDANGTPLSDEAQKALTCATTDGSGTAYTFRGANALKVSVDYAALKQDSVDIDGVRIYMTWSVDNPFQGKTGLTASDYSSNLSIGAVDFNATDAVISGERLLTASGTNLMSGNSQIIATRDNQQVDGGTLTSLDTSGSKLTAKVQLAFLPFVDGALQPATATMHTCLLTGYGIGRNTNPTKDSTSAYVPYRYMSGTSMATPMVTGCVAELASLYPNYTPLQLRGLICGGTTPLASADDQAKVASGGRFTFANALNNSQVNANTWSITTSGDQVTVHGYNLQNAKLYVDDSTYTYATKPISQTASSITFAAPSSLLDGKTHRFDVVDGTTGRTYKAAYVTPDASKDSLVRVHDLPTVAGADTGTLVSTADRLFCVDGNGTYLYSCTDPSDATSSWTKLTASGTPWTGSVSSNNRITMTFCCADGKLYAFATDDVAATATTQEQVAVFCNTYDIASDSWSGFKEAFRTPSKVIISLAVGCMNGSLTAYISSTGGTRLFIRPSGSDAFTEVEMSSTTSWQNTPGFLCPHGSMFYGLGAISPSQGVYETSLLYLDPSKHTLNYVSGLPYETTTNVYREQSLVKSPQAAVGNGLVVAGQSTTGYGDLQLVGIDGGMTKLGSYGLSAADGLTVGSMAMYDGRLYLDCVDHTGTDTSATAQSSGLSAQSGSHGVGIYTVPATAASKLTTNDVIETAAASDGGSATVSDWRGSAASTLTMRAGDTATWTAVADDGYTFAGWYDASGNEVSGEATYATVATGSQTLTARFTAAVVSPTPTPSVTTTPTPTVTGTVTPTPTVTSAAAASDSDAGSTGTTGTTSGSGSSGVKTGDSTVALVLALLALLAGGTALAIARKRTDQ